jgi:uncharacterized protein YfaP (DUF2135 family)
MEVVPASPAGPSSVTLFPAEMTEGFEGDWPSAGWTRADISSADGGEYLVGKRDCAPHSGSYAGWMVGDGADGSGLACDGTYPDNASTWAKYGPFSLADATSAELIFYLVGQSEGGDQCSYDSIFAGSSTDGSSFRGYRYCGDWTGGPDSNGYSRLTLDLASRLGEGQVWILFKFVSDSSLGDNGFTIDDVALHISGGPSEATPTTTRRPGVTPTTTRRPSTGYALPLLVRNLRVAGATLRNSKGQPASALEISDALYADFTGLLPKTQYDIQVLDPGGAELTLSRFTADNRGSIPTSALAYDLGLTMSGGQSVALTAVGRHTVVIRDLSGREVRRWTIPLNEPTGPILYAADSRGNASNSFLKGSHTVYARGEHFTPGSRVALYVVADNTDWASGTPLADVSGGAEEVTVGSDGKFLVPVWSSPSPIAAYDLVADADRNGVYSAGDVVDSYTPVGFMVQRAGTGAHIQVQLACDERLNYKDVFLTAEGVYIKVNPPTQQFVHRFGYKYVVLHKDVWYNGDVLVDITEGPERDHPQYGCTNEGRVLIWPPTLIPGVYDVIFDINANGKYDVGLDLLDNIDSFGNPVGGFFVPGSPDAPAVTITSPTDGSSDSDGVITLQGMVSSTTSVTWAKWYVNAGRQSNSGDLTISRGSFSQQVYLFPGSNIVQVWVRNAKGTGVASITVYSLVSGVWDIHAQLVWDTVGTDEDLHLLRPQGQRNSGGDCYYSNCTPDRTNKPDWGVVGDPNDNPHLDIDCVPSKNCTGPENITLNTLGRPEGNGRYTIEVYYYNDWSKGAAHPRVNLWVRGHLYTFGPVTTTNHQWWTVCYIDLPSGLVTPVNRVGAHPEAASEDAAERFPPKEGDKAK